MHKLLLFITIIITLLSLIPSAYAGETISSMQKKIEVFTKSPDYTFAGITTARAQAYLGAAMMADEQDHSEEVQKALIKASEALKEAQTSAEIFQKRHKDLLLLRLAAQQAIMFIPVSDALPKSDTKGLLKIADDTLDKAVKTNETGQLNLTSQAINDSQQAYILALKSGLPFLIDKTGSFISKALGARAKRYAPKTYASAKLELSELQQYSEGLIDTPPLHPTFALSLAKQAFAIASQVKELKRHSQSYEQLLLSAQHDRLAIAAILSMPLDTHDATFDISIDKLTQALKDKIQQQQQTYEVDMATLRQQQQTLLLQETAKLRTSLTDDQHTQLRNMKDAFRAKLNRETFELRRQKQVRDLFKKGEVEMSINLDGSVLLRLLALNFSSNSSKISRGHYDLLLRVKRALEAYADRKINIEGHTDNIGDPKPNLRLSLRRAEAIRDFLIDSNIKIAKLTARGWGESFPIATNDYKQGRAKNRRIDIIIQTNR